MPAHPLSVESVSADDRWLRLQQPDKRLRIAKGKRERKYRPRNKRQPKPGMWRH